MEIGCFSEVGRLTHLLVKRPEDAFIDQDHLEAHWREFGFSACPDFVRARAEYDVFFCLLQESVPHIECLPRSGKTGLDSLYVRDALLVIAGRVLVPSMGKARRRGEPQAAAAFLEAHGIPVLGVIRAPGCVEGGDVVLFDSGTLAVGLGYRTNAEGIRQLTDLVKDLGYETLTVPLPHWEGSSGVLHLMSLISPLDHDLALVHSPLLPVFFRSWLLERGITLLEVPRAEFDSMGGNVLAVAPRDVIMLAGNPRTQGILEEAGVAVRVYEGTHISRLGAGGPTCLTRPLLRKG